MELRRSMFARPVRTRLIGVLLLMIVMLGVRAASTEAVGASYWLDPASQTVSMSDAPVVVDIGVRDGAGVSSFEFTIRYNPDVLELVDAKADTSFISAAGTPLCPKPIVDADAGTVTIGCVTALANAGASGSGLLGRLTFDQLRPGKSDLVFTKADLSDSLANAISASVMTGVVRVVGEGESVSSSAPEPTPTVNTDLLTPTPSVAGAGPTVETVPREDTVTNPVGSAGPATGRPVIDTSAAGSGASPPSAAGAVTGADGGPVAGHGSQSRGASPWPRLAAVSFALLGASVLVVGEWRRRY